MRTIPTLKVKKRKVLKEDGRYLIYFTFEQMDSQDEVERAMVDGKTTGLCPTLKPENGERQ